MQSLLNCFSLHCNLATIDGSYTTFAVTQVIQTNTIWCAFLSVHCMMTTKLIKCRRYACFTLLREMKFQQEEAL